MFTEELLPCPRCGQQKYRKVTEIVAEGTPYAEIPIIRRMKALSEKSLAWYEATQEIYYTTRLAQRLQRPADLLANPFTSSCINVVVKYLLRYKKSFLEQAKQEDDSFVRGAYKLRCANQRYDRLNYCYICDGVFDPKDKQKRVFSPWQMLLFLFSE